jgi:hypothetical protein
MQHQAAWRGSDEILLKAGEEEIEIDQNGLLTLRQIPVQQSPGKTGGSFTKKLESESS